MKINRSPKSASQQTDQSVCVTRKLARLYQFLPPDNLTQRFAEVDIEALSALAVSGKKSQLHPYMKGPLSYIGGKNRIATKIIEIFPKHKTYVEVFAGGAQVLFHKEPSSVEVLNDLDADVVTFFRVCQSHHDELVRYMNFMIVSREWFDLLNEQDPKFLTDIQRSARFFFLQKNAYGGLVRNRAFGYSVEESSRFNPERLPDLIANTHKRLIRVQVEHLPYQDILQRYDRATTLFYLDPPYFGRKLYNFNFSESDFKDLAERLRKVRGKFVLSLNDVPEVRTIFAGFKFRGIELPYTVQGAPGKLFRELLITNFPPRRGGAR